MSDTLPTLLINLVPEDKIDPRTWEAKFSHPVTRLWFSTTQMWAWEGGDALVVLTNNHYGEPECWIVLRMGDRFEVFAAPSIAAGLRAFGYESRVAPLPS